MAKTVLILLLFFCGCAVTKPPIPVPIAPSLTVSLDGSGSFETQGQDTIYAYKFLSYYWQQLSGTIVNISMPYNTISPVTFYSKGIYQFQLTVMDSSYQTDTALKTITIN
jgi:hypothetical protein